jgi:hypothetical protein
MRAIIYAEKGRSRVMSLAERPVPEPGAGQVRVRVMRAGVNPTDWKARAGVGSPMEFPEVTPGQDGATQEAGRERLDDLLVEKRILVPVGLPAVAADGHVHPGRHQHERSRPGRPSWRACSAVVSASPAPEADEAIRNLAGWVRPVLGLAPARSSSI